MQPWQDIERIVWIYIVAFPFTAIAFLEVLVLGIVPAALAWRMTLPLLLRTGMPVRATAALSGFIATVAVLGCLLGLTLAFRGADVSLILLPPLAFAVQVGGPIAIVVGPILAALLLQIPRLTAKSQT